MCDGACASSPSNYHPNRTGRILVKARHMLYLELRHLTKMPVLFEIIHFNMGKGLYLSQLSFLKHLSNFSTTHYVCVAVISQFIPYVVLHDYGFLDHVTHLFQIKTHVHQMRHHAFNREHKYHNHADIL